jgi:DNA (cytosine-5)-methyltransferase 1
MRVLDLFSGIGGFSLGLERAGMKTVAFCEIDPYCRAVLKKHWPDVPIHEDIRKLDGTRISADLVCGGFPCQPFSHAGKRRGSEDDRHLWPQMCRVIAEVRPAWVVGENVPGIIGMELDNVLSDLEALGYATRTFVVPAAAVDARHRRDRIWVVAHADGVRCARLGGGGEEGTPEHGQAVADPYLTRLEVGEGIAGDDGEERQAAVGGSRWLPEPAVGRVAHGVPSRVDRLRALGNAVVPQVVEVIGKAIVQAEMTA